MGGLCTCDAHSDNVDAPSLWSDSSDVTSIPSIPGGRHHQKFSQHRPKCMVVHSAVVVAVNRRLVLMPVKVLYQVDDFISEDYMRSSSEGTRKNAILDKPASMGTLGTYGDIDSVEPGYGNINFVDHGYGSSDLVE